MWSHNTQIPAGRTRIGPVLPEGQDRDRRHGIYSFLMFSVFLVYIFYCSLDYYVGFNRADLYAGLHTHMFNSPLSGTTQWASTRKVKRIWILLKQKTVSGSGISWAICKSAPCSRQITTPTPHHSVIYRPNALPATHPTALKHWRHWALYTGLIGSKVSHWLKAP